MDDTKFQSDFLRNFYSKSTTPQTLHVHSQNVVLNVPLWFSANPSNSRGTAAKEIRFHPSRIDRYVAAILFTNLHELKCMCAK